MRKNTDPEVLATQLVRNLAELAWLPAFALADPALIWADAVDSALEIRSSAGDWEYFRGKITSVAYEQVA